MSAAITTKMTLRIPSSPINARSFLKGADRPRSMSLIGKTIGEILFLETSPLNLKR